MTTSNKMPSIPIAQTYSQILSLFQNPERFATGYFQKDKEGNNCEPDKGYSFCVLGALYSFTEGTYNNAQCCLQRVSEYMYGKYIQLVNDEPDGYQKVLTALEFAIDLWKDHEPSYEELVMSVPDLLEKRKAQ